MDEVLLRADKVGKTFQTGFFMKRVTAVHDISFEVPAGASVGLVGPNGAGKTTTLKLALGLAFPSSGSVTLFGRRAGDPEAFRQLGYMPENPYIYQYLRPLEFLDLCGTLAGLDRATRKERAAYWIERVGLGHAVDRPVGKFSKGMMQRVGLAQALMHDPRFIILDEPMSGLDPGGRILVRELLLEERRRGKTLLIASHILHDVEALCDRIVMIHQGRVAATGSMSSLCRDTGRVELVFDRDFEALHTWASELGTEVLHRGERAALFVTSWEDARTLIARSADAPARLLRVEAEQEHLESLFLRLSSPVTVQGGILQNTPGFSGVNPKTPPPKT